MMPLFLAAALSGLPALCSASESRVPAVPLALDALPSTVVTVPAGDLRPMAAEDFRAVEAARGLMGPGYAVLPAANWLPDGYGRSLLDFVRSADRHEYSLDDYDQGALRRDVIYQERSWDASVPQGWHPAEALKPARALVERLTRIVNGALPFDERVVIKEVELRRKEAGDPDPSPLVYHTDGERDRPGLLYLRGLTTLVGPGTVLRAPAARALGSGDVLVLTPEGRASSLGDAVPATVHAAPGTLATRLYLSIDFVRRRRL